MSSRQARVGAAILSLILHAALLWIVAGWSVTKPGDGEADLDRVVVSLAPPPAAQPPAAPPPPPPPPVAPPEAVQAPEMPDEPAPAEPAPQEEAPAEPPPPEVEIPLPEQQIVSMPDAGEERPPSDTRFLSDRDNVVEEETVSRGEPAPSQDLDGDDIAAADPDSDVAEPDPEIAAAEILGAGEAAEPGESNAAGDSGDGRAKRPMPDLASLMPNALALAAQQARQEPAPASEPGGAPERKARKRSAVAWEPSTALRGTLDHLPDIRPGNVTLLNTKAEVFAPFVRRVMMRVFQNMMIMLRRSAGSMRPGANEQIEAEAIMSPDGRMLGLRFTQRSTSMSIGLDRLLTDACNEAFFDRNPPPGAIGKDGNIHFVMRTVVQTFPAQGRGVALSGLFGVGLL